MEARMRFLVLGPVQVARIGGQRVTLSSPKQRLLLAVLLGQFGEPVSTERLIDKLWPDRPPPSAAANLRSLVHQLRHLLGASVVSHDRHGGYALRAGREQIDAEEFLELRAKGRQALAAGDPAEASRHLHRAMRLWRGEPYGDLCHEAALTAEVARLNEYRALAQEDQFEADLALGLHEELVGELARAVAEQSFRERRHGQLMLALYRCGRQSEALAAYRRIRATLADELGIEPGPELAALHESMLRGDPSLHPPRPVAPPSPSTAAPALLPPDIGTFMGRDAELAALDALLRRDRPDTVVISAIDGMAGVGKTALAVHWGHRVRRNYPDGQLYLDLRGYSPTAGPLPPIDALRILLAALGLPAQDVPATVEDAAGRYRSLLADRRMLIVLDNAHEAEQVRPLLPGGSGCLVVVTSRNRLSGLVAHDDAHRLQLGLLSLGESVGLLTTILRDHGMEPEPAEVAELAQLCGYLPLALRIAAAKLIDRPQESIRAYTQQLHAGGRLRALRVDDDHRAVVEVALDLSVRALSAPARLMLCLISLAPGNDSSDGSAAALIGCPVGEAAAGLAELSRRHLLAEYRPGRFRAHDLVRAHAAELARREMDAADLDAALDRLIGWYCETAARADALLRPSVHVPAVVAARPEEWQRQEWRPEEWRPELATSADAVDWFEAERDNLIAAVTAGTGRPGQIWRLAASMRGWLQRRAPRHTWIELYRLGVAAARADGDLAGEATLLTGLAIAHSLLLEQKPATEAYWTAISIFEQIGDAVGVIDAIGSLGGLLADTGAVDQSLPLLRWACEQATELADLPDLRFKVEMNLGYAYRLSGDLKLAIHHYHAAAEVAEKSAERPWLMASVLRNVGAAQLVSGEYHQAASTFRTVLDLARQTGDRIREADALDGLAEVAEALGQTAEAAEQLADAIEILQPVGGPQLTAWQARLAALRGDG